MHGCISNSHFNEVEVKVKVEEKKNCVKSIVLTEKYRKFRCFSLTSTSTSTFFLPILDIPLGIVSGK
jgi:hypothetical protein